MWRTRYIRSLCLKINVGTVSRSIKWAKWWNSFYLILPNGFSICHMPNSLLNGWRWGGRGSDSGATSGRLPLKSPPPPPSLGRPFKDWLRLGSVFSQVQLSSSSASEGTSIHRVSIQLRWSSHNVLRTKCRQRQKTTNQFDSKQCGVGGGGGLINLFIRCRILQRMKIK
jgi:hypothetical protein